MTDLITIQYYTTDLVDMILGSYDGKLCLFNYRDKKSRTAVDSRIKNGLNAEFIEQSCPILTQTREQLDQYFSGERLVFDVPILMVGTCFQKTVWNALMSVPYGETLSYSELARRIDKPKAVRAVANANQANALSFIIPCHRIIGSNGQLVGYGGGLATKQRLITHEQRVLRTLS